MADMDGLALGLEDLQIREKARQNQQSPLLRLPGEIRNLIYDYVFDDVIWVLGSERVTSNYQNTNTVFHARSAADDREDGQHVSTPRNHVLAMTLVCRDLYIETRLVPFRSTEFYVKCLTSLDLWLQGFAPLYMKTFHANLIVDTHSGYFRSISARPPTWKYGAVFGFWDDKPTPGEIPHVACLGCKNQVGLRRHLWWPKLYEKINLKIVWRAQYANDNTLIAYLEAVQESMARVGHQLTFQV